MGFMTLKMNFSITQIEYVLALYQYGHFAKAASACFVTQPTLSMQIQKLEENLGVIIFDRSKKPILLTEEGKKLIEQFKKIISETKKIEDIITLDPTLIEGELKIGIIPTVTSNFLPLILPALNSVHPKLHLIIKELETKNVLEFLEKEIIDVGLLATPLKHSKLFTIPLFYEPFYVLSHKDHPLAKFKKITYGQLKHDDIWLLEEGHCLRNQVLNTCNLKLHKKKNFTFESGNLETIRNLVDACGGYSIIPYFNKFNVGLHSKIIPFENPIPCREISLVYRREHLKSHLIQALASIIENILPKDIVNFRKSDFEIMEID